MKVTDLSSYLSAVADALKGSRDRPFFRGHGNSSFKSQPKVFRDFGWTDSEDKLLRGLVEMHPEEFSNDHSTLEKLVRAQHFGLPTRLLDITLNPLVALYFCCRDQRNEDGEVVIYFIADERIKSFDSDTVSVIANTALLKQHERDKIDKTVNDHFSHVKTYSISDFNRLAPLPRLLHFIQSEKSYFLPKIQHEAFRQYVAVLPKRNNRRMIAQSGAFIVFATNRVLTNSLSPKISIEKILISSVHKKGLLEQLDHLNINHGSLFPDVSSASEYLSEKYEFGF